MIAVAKCLTPDKTWIGRLEPGTDIIHALESFCQENNIRTAWIQCLGAVKKATISYYDQQACQYHHRELLGEFEIVSCYGNISLKDNKPFAHLHATFSDDAYQCHGGHLWPGTTEVFMCEFSLQTFQDDPNLPPPLCRLPDPTLGLALWPAENTQ